MNKKEFKTGDKIIYYPPIDENTTEQQIFFAGLEGVIKGVIKCISLMRPAANIKFENGNYVWGVPLEHLKHKIVVPLNFEDFVSSILEKEEKEFNVGDEVVFWVKDIEEWSDFWKRVNGAKAVIRKVHKKVHSISIDFEEGIKSFVDENHVYPVSEMRQVGDKYYPKNLLHHIYTPEHVKVSASMLGIPSYLHRIFPLIFCSSPDYSNRYNNKYFSNFFNSKVNNFYNNERKVDMYPDNTCPRTKELTPREQISQKRRDLEKLYAENEKMLDITLESYIKRIETIEEVMEKTRQEFSKEKLALDDRVTKLIDLDSSINWDTASEELQNAVVIAADNI